ncbi:hypothetical protein HPB49_000095 [Dermacentor silvarum]|uniref:Uncharacterized protein n=1 Tax=Dermacentor silvarum TaxID=543639 RepID=A0ACB8C1C6_DERSI|nr:hypothetical protein HPB49_000095 [Dermacentor silvarum]
MNITVCGKRTNERYVFRMHVQEKGEPFEQFLRYLQLNIQSCQFSQLKDSLLRDQIVYGMLREQDLSLARAVRMCRAAEVAKKQDEMLEETKETVAKVEQEARNEYAHSPASFPPL